MKASSAFKSSRVNNLIRNAHTGVYYYRQRVNVNGKSRQVWKSLRTTDFEKAQAVLAQTMQVARSEAAEFRPTNGAIYTVGDAIELLRQAQWSVDGRTDPLKPRSLAYYEERCACLVKYWPTLLTTPLAQLQRPAVKEWAQRFSAEYSPQAFNTALAIIRNAYRIAIQHQACAHNPTDGLKRAGQKNETVPELPSAEQFNDMLRVLDCAVWRDAAAVAGLVRVLAYSGLRIRECAGLRWKDVDFDAGLVWVNHQLNDDGQLVTPKNGKSRFVEMNAQLRETLLKMWNAAERKEPTDRVTTIDSCQNSLDHAAKVVGCPRIRQHDLRHLFATRCVECGVDFKTLALWMGHQDGGILAAKLYAHVRRDHSRRMGQQVSFETPPAAENVAPLPQAATA